MDILWHLRTTSSFLKPTSFGFYLKPFSNQYYECLLFNQALNVNVFKGLFFISTPDSAFPIIFMPSSIIISKHWIPKNSPQIQISRCFGSVLTLWTLPPLVFQRYCNSSHPNPNSSNCSKFQNRQTRLPDVLLVQG